MSSKHSPRLYEILKSYQKNNSQWFFEINELKYLLDCENYQRWPDFKRRVLDPAVEEINKYTDLSIAYKDVRKGRAVVRVEFFMDKKTNTELRQVNSEISGVLDGQLSMFDDEDVAAIKEAKDNNPELQFKKARLKARQQEREQKNSILGWLDPSKVSENSD